MSIFTDARRTIYLWRTGTIFQDQRPQYVQAPMELVTLSTGANGALEQMLQNVGTGDSTGQSDMVSTEWNYREWLGRGGIGGPIEAVEFEDELGAGWGSGSGSDFGDMKKLHYFGWI